MGRTTSNKFMSATVTEISGSPQIRAGIQQSAALENAMRLSKWPDRVFRRLLVDTHIPDWDPTFLNRLDPVEYVDYNKRSGFQSLMPNANFCVCVCLCGTQAV